MAVLSNIDLRNAMKNDDGVIISRIREGNITAAGYDLSIGFICDADEGTEVEIDPVSNRYCLRPRHRYLVVSHEHISLSGSYMGTLHSRVSYVTKGLMVSSTTIDPNFHGFIYSVLTNCSETEIYVKKNNAFLTMVVHRLQTPTNMLLQKNEDNTPRDGYGAASGPFSNLHPQASRMAKEYFADSAQKVQEEYQAARERYAKKLQRTQDDLSSAQILQNMKTQLDSMQEQMDADRQKNLRKNRNLKWIVLGLIVLCAVLLFATLYSIWGATLWTVVLSVLPILLAVPSFIVDSKQVKKEWKEK